MISIGLLPLIVFVAGVIGFCIGDVVARKDIDRIVELSKQLWALESRKK